MRRLVLSSLAYTAFTLCVTVSSASAQPVEFVGTFRWQTAPYCNVIQVNVSRVGGLYTLDGFDDRCTLMQVSSVTGQAIVLGASVRLGLTIVGYGDAEPTHMEALISLGSLLGQWTDNAGHTGNFVLNGNAAGNLRPVGQEFLTAFNETAAIIGRRSNGTPVAPTAVLAGEQLMTIGARAETGSGMSGFTEARISLVASEDWTLTARGTRIDFATNANGTASTNMRMRIDHDGQVGIGVGTPAQQLDVAGNIRIGSGANGCVEDRDGTLLTGVCSSDARFKRDITSFEPMLSKVASLRPVHFYWRADEFPTRAFGSRQSYGLVAQEVEEILPELVTTNADGYKAVNYSQIPLVALQAIKELKEKNDALEAQNAAIERRLAELEARAKQ